MTSLTTVRLPFGKTHIEARVPSANLTGIFEPHGIQQTADEHLLISEALQHPIASPRLRELVQPGQKVAIMASDLTRPCPSARLLPFVLKELAEAGVRDEDVLIVAALGLHRQMTLAELERMAGLDAYRRFQVINHNPGDVVYLGTTQRGTPVEVFRPVVEADFRVCLGNVEFHYFVGYSGGAKAIIPGCASKKTVTANHAWMVHPDAVSGTYVGNPVRADLEEAAAMVGVDFILNVVVDAHHRILAAVAGDGIAAHRVGCDWIAQRGKVAIPRQGDIVVVSPGGYPKDVNLYQAQKALDGAALAVRPGGIIIWVAECPEGLGNDVFEQWFTSGWTCEQLLDRIQQEFVLGGHKAAAIAKVALQAQLMLVSPNLVDLSLSGMEHQPTVNVALDTAFARLGSGAGVLVFPQGASILPQPPAGGE
jgi:nickel-dependent lactate racemase